jgi:hypothetical protein
VEPRHQRSLLLFLLFLMLLFLLLLGRRTSCNGVRVVWSKVYTVTVA